MTLRYVPKIRRNEWGGVGAPLNLQRRWPKSIEHRREGKKPYVQKDLERTRCAVHWSPRKPEMRLNSCDTCESYGPACLNISPLASIRLLLCFYSYILVQNWLNSVLKENSNFGCLKLRRYILLIVLLVVRVEIYSITAKPYTLQKNLIQFEFVQNSLGCNMGMIIFVLHGGC